MATIDELIRKMNRFNVADTIHRSLENTTRDLVHQQVEQQYKGEDVNGGKIGKYRNKAYAFKKYMGNPMPGFGNVDLHLTGDLHKATFAEVRERSVVFGSMDEKYPELA